MPAGDVHRFRIAGAGRSGRQLSNAIAFCVDAEPRAGGVGQAGCGRNRRIANRIPVIFKAGGLFTGPIGAALGLHRHRWDGSIPVSRTLGSVPRVFSQHPRYRSRRPHGSVRSNPCQRNIRQIRPVRRVWSKYKKRKIMMSVTICDVLCAGCYQMKCQRIGP